MKLPEPSDVLDLTSIEELIKARIINEESFTALLQKFWLELKEKANGEERIHYWDFIYAPSYEETVIRAYLTSFLVTYGFATMEIEPLEEETFLVPYMELRELSLKEQMISFPISIDYDIWKEMAERQ